MTQHNKLRLVSLLAILYLVIPAAQLQATPISTYSAVTSLHAPRNAGNTADGPLPVALVAFTANVQTGYNQLRWKTTSAVDIRSYLIEFSTDGTTWTTAGNVLPSESYGDSLYDYKHATSYYGTIYYRLKMFAADNSFTYFRIISVDTDGTKGKEMQLFPTTITYGKLQVQLNESFVNMQVFNMQGQRLQVRNLQNQTGVIRLEVSGFNKGMYTVVVSRPDKTISKTFMVQ